MDEEAVSVALFRAANADDALEVLSWQAVDGKGYFTADIKLRLPNGDRVEPDLILTDGATVWVIEVKPNHLRAVEDERKLVATQAELGDQGIVEQIRRRVRGLAVPDVVVLGVAYDADNVQDLGGCEPVVIHLSWSELESHIVADGLAAVLRRLSQP